MPVAFHCPCGQPLHAPDEQAGHTLHCPACGQGVTVPASEAVLTAEALLASKAGVLPGPDDPRGVGATRTPEGRAEFPHDGEASRTLPLPAETSDKATASLMLGLLSLCLWVIAALPAITLGAFGLRDIGRSQGQLQGKGRAVAGLVLGGLGLFFLPAIFVIWLPPAEREDLTFARLESGNHLKQIGLALHVYNGAQGGLPGADIGINRQPGRPGLSWRVVLLPYIDQVDLFRQFRLDEAWDSPHNKRLIPLMPKVFAHPLHPEDAREGLTYYRGFTGPNTPFAGNVKIKDIARADGLANTLLVVEAAEPVPWTKPDELVYDPDGPLPRLGGHFPAGTVVGLCNGEVRFLRPDTSDRTLRNAITFNDGQPLGPDWP